MSDGNLRVLFKEHLKHAHISSIETWTAEAGVPDMNICIEGREVWVENKQIEVGWKPRIRPGQVGWIDQRIRNGGTVFICIRRCTFGTPQKAPVDDIYLYNGAYIKYIFEKGIKDLEYLLFEDGGPSMWDWDAIRKVLTTPLPPIADAGFSPIKKDRTQVAET